MFFLHSANIQQISGLTCFSVPAFSILPSRFTLPIRLESVDARFLSEWEPQVQTGTKCSISVLYFVQSHMLRDTTRRHHVTRTSLSFPHHHGMAKTLKTLSAQPLFQIIRLDKQCFRSVLSGFMSLPTIIRG
jgi:hypothetical protein